MRTSLGSFLFSAVVGALLAVGCGGKPTCDASSCSGCCDAQGQCQTGNSNLACGSGALTCSVCSTSETCSLGRCASSGTGGGGGATGGGGGSTGGGGGSIGGGGGSTGGGGGSTTGGGGGSTGGGGGSTTGGGGGSTGGGGGSTGGGGGSTGGGGGSTGGGGGSSDAGTVLDAGVTLPDGGMLNPPTVPLTFSANCGTVTACAGNEVGEWYYSAGCIDDSAFTAIENVGNNFGCTGATSNKRGYVAGVIGFNGTSLARTVATEISFTVTLTGAVCVANCSVVPGLLQSGTTGSCAATTTACVCDLTTRVNDSGSQGYTYNAGVLTLASSGETYNTCITGTQLDYRETSSNNREPGKFSLTKY